jgi:hypothetical protein
MNDIQKYMITEFQCAGCVNGSSPDDGCFIKEEVSLSCDNHIARNNVLPIIGTINLGLPIGFNRLGPIDTSKQKNNIRLYDSMPKDHWDKFNIPVWAMEKDGYLFVRTYLPRTNVTWVDVIKDGKINEVDPYPINVGDFIDEIN